MNMIWINGVLCDDYLSEDDKHIITQFARCGCTQACSCVIQAGDNTTVTGNGGANSPYVISSSGGAVSICAEPNGVENVPNNGSDPACPAGGLLVKPSSTAGNVLTFGADNRLYVPTPAAGAAAPERQTFSHAGTPTAGPSGPWYPEGSGTGLFVRASLGTAGSTSTVVTIYRNGVSIGSVTLVAGDLTEVATFAMAIVGNTTIITVGAPTVGTGASDLVVQTRVVT